MGKKRKYTFVPKRRSTGKELDLKLRRINAKRKVMPAINASKNGRAEPRHVDFPDHPYYYSYVYADRAGMPRFWDRGPRRQPWANLTLECIRFIEDNDWVPSEPMSPLEELAKAAGTLF